MPVSAENSSRTRDAAATFGAMLMREAFAPIAKSLGFYGDTLVGLVAQKMARSERGGLTDRLERAIEDASREPVEFTGASR